MVENTTAKIRDFVYLDVERVKSALAQLDEGVTEQVSKLVGDSSTSSTGGKIGFAGLGGLEHIGGVITSTSTTESATFHDFLYNHLESKLLEAESLVVTSQQLDDELVPVDFVLADGTMALNDFGYMATMIEELEQIQQRLARVQAIDSWMIAKTPKAKKQVLEDATRSAKSGALPKWFGEDLGSILRSFYGDGLLIRCTSTTKLGALKLSGPLAATWLRDTPEALRIKYGLRPSGRWHVFGQVTSVPWSIDSGDDRAQPAKAALEEIFDHSFEMLDGLRNAFDDAREIKITPIAVFREKHSS